MVREVGEGSRRVPEGQDEEIELGERGGKDRNMAQLQNLHDFFLDLLMFSQLSISDKEMSDSSAGLSMTSEVTTSSLSSLTLETVRLWGAEESW